MFTIKYRTYVLSAKQSSDGPFYDEHEQIHGPFELISKEQDENGYSVVHAHRDSCAPGISFGDTWKGDETAGVRRPRPTLWVMNEQGATIAKYDL